MHTTIDFRGPTERSRIQGSRSAMGSVRMLILRPRTDPAAVQSS